MLKAGDRFGDYAVVRLLGQGGMGSVFLLENAEGAQVAAKILDPESAGDEESRKRFLREAQLALGVKHPNLVETYDVGEDPDTGLCYILMEYVPGGSLADRLKAGPLSVNDAIRIVYQIAAVLELARQKGIVHRDIKPDNIMFGADGKAKLADLGIARGGVGGTGVTTVTQTGMMIGTPAYMSPEQMLDAHNVDCRADIYSLGVVFFEMLTGERPNKDDTVVQLMARAVAGEPIPDVRTLRPEVSASIAELVSLMCAMKADERVATPAEVTTALSQIAHGREVTIRRKRPTAVPPRKRGFPKAIVPVLILCGLAAAGAWFYVGHRPQRPMPQAASVPAAADEAVRPLPSAVPPQSDVARKSPVREQASEKPRAEAVAVPARPRKPSLTFDIGKGERLEFASCPAGTFMMGLSGPYASGYPAHRVEITRPYWMSRYQLTWRQWTVLTGEPHEPTKVEIALGGDRCPVMQRKREDVEALCARLTRRFAKDIPSGYAFRLPTYAEWEYASRSGDEGGDDDYGLYRRGGARRQSISWQIHDGYEALKRAGCETFPDRAAFEDAITRRWKTHGKLTEQERKWLFEAGHPAAVGQKAANRWGIYDLFGNGNESLLDRVDSRFGPGPIRSGLSWEGLERDPLLTGETDDSQPVSALAKQGMLVADGTEWKKCWSIRLVVGPMDFNDGRTRVRIPAETRRNETVREYDWSVRETGIKPRRLALDKNLGIDFIGCPSGTFTMGCYDPAEVSAVSWKDRESIARANHVRHKVTISRPFWMSKYPVTYGVYEEVLGDLPEIGEHVARLNAVQKALKGQDVAAGRVFSRAARIFCERLTKRFAKELPEGYVVRLPSLAEFEYALRSGGGSDSSDPHCLRDREGFSRISGRLGAGYRGRNRLLAEKGLSIPAKESGFVGLHPTVPVGLYAPNRWGFYDFFGNVDYLVLDTFPASRLTEHPEDWCHLIANVGDPMDGTTETDPLNCCPDDKVVGSLVSGSSSGWQPLFGCHYRICHIDYCHGTTGFRVVIGPDLERGRRKPYDRARGNPISAKPKSANVPPLPSKTFKLPKKVVLDLVGCPAGTFRMGYEDAPPKHTEAAVHEVKLTRPFWIGRHPVTREQWSSLMNRVSLDAVDEALGGMKAPVTGITAAEIREFCQKLQRKFRSGMPRGYVFRLPTDAEWEYALRGGSDDPDDPHVGRCHSSEVLSLFAVRVEDKKARLAKAGIGEGLIPKGQSWFIGPCEVCTKRPNGWGLYDMLGNIDERVLDAFPVENPDGSFKKHVAVLNGEITYRPSETDPLRMCEGDTAIGMIRGVLDGRTPGMRRFYSQTAHDRPVGFRVVLAPDLEREMGDAVRAAKRRR